MNVLVTGVGRYLGAHLAVRLADHPQVTRVIGVDTVPPIPDLMSILGDRAWWLPGAGAERFPPPSP